ncbi:MAG: hypothetical protein CR994_04745 [Maribacter sp.]|nr:MAG: hypothetical protein CR994_04745 [Maribacter sp.]
MIGRTGNIFFVVFLLIGSAVSNAQKIVKKSIFDTDFTYLEINAETCFKVELTTSESKEIVVEACIDGEYRNDLLVKLEHNGPVIELSTGFYPGFVKPNDKLSAHKVISISLEVRIPNNMKVSLLGTSTHVFAKGSYDYLKIVLDDGICNLDSFSGMAEVITRGGDINVSAKSAMFETRTDFGKIESDSIPEGDDFYDLTTTTGDIHLMKME